VENDVRWRTAKKQLPAGLTVANLKLDPFWDPLRKDPRFLKLCEQ
jgi:hypothetical protein